MKKRFRWPLLFLLCLFSLQVWAQEHQVTGTVKDPDGLPLPGVNVMVKNTKKGTVTDFDGEFSLDIPDSENIVLVFSSLGLETQEVTTGGKSSFEITMQNTTEGLGEVLVTALGIKRDKKALSYAVQSVESEKLMEGNNQNLVNGLQGKVSGVTIANSGGAPGSSSVIMIRGGTSITGNNQPLFVVDGIPIDNSTNSSLQVASTNRASDLNPEDIESISILKGPSAAALYGIQASEGAVIITTKKGKAGKGIISYSGSVSFDEVLGAPKEQQVYGQGKQLEKDPGVITYDPDSDFSWGEKIGSGTKTYNHNQRLLYYGVHPKSQRELLRGFRKNTILFFCRRCIPRRGGRWNKL